MTTRLNQTSLSSGEIQLQFPKSKDQHRCSSIVTNYTKTFFTEKKRKKTKSKERTLLGSQEKKPRSNGAHQASLETMRANTVLLVRE